MRAMLLDAPGKPLRAAEIAEPEPGPGELLLRVNACAVCRTDLHIVDGELTRPKLPLVLGHMIAAEVVGDGRRVFAFTRPGDAAGQAFARELGTQWAGGSDEAPPEELDAAIIFAPVGALVPAALRAVRKAGVLVCAGIHMSDIPQFPYELLWGERVVRSVANLSRRDGEEFLALAPQVPVRTQVRSFALEEANEAIEHLRRGEVHGSAVLHLAAAG